MLCKFSEFFVDFENFYESAFMAFYIFFWSEEMLFEKLATLVNTRRVPAKTLERSPCKWGA